jgi:hypothetical protein
MRWAGYVVYMEKVRNAYKMLGKHNGKRSLGRRCNRWDDDNIKMDFREKLFGDVNWIHLAQDMDC